jgi:CHAT domain-containing protein
MARHTAQLFRAIQVVILAIGGCLLSLAIANATTVNPDHLIQRGYGELDAGQFSSARQTWQQAEQIYRRQRNPIGVAGSLINQSLAQRVIGQNLSACYSATAALAVDHHICRGQGDVTNLVPRSPESITILGLNTLGDSLSDLGYWEEAEVVLKQALQRANQAELWQSLGQVYQQSNQTTPAIAAYQTALQLAQSASQTTVVTYAQINLLELQEFNLAAFQAIDLSGLPGIFKAKAHLKLARILRQSQPQLALQQAEAALGIGQTLMQPRVESEAMTLIGQIHTELGSPDIPTLQQAIALAQSVRAGDLAYPAQVLLAQTWQAQGESALAQNAYQGAIRHINQVRQQLKGTASRIQTDFYTEVKPIYRNYLELLFDDPTNIPAIIQTSTQLQVSELENFLGCQLDDWMPIEQVPQTANTTLIFVVRGRQHYQVILRRPQQPDYAYLVDAAALDLASFNLLANVGVDTLYDIDTEIISNYGKNLYAALLQPAAAHLPPQGTLAFVLDPSLQNIPIDLLHDGQTYLIQQYSLSLMLGAQMRQPKSIPPQKLKVLLAGVSAVAPSFPPRFPALTQTAAELVQIQTSIGGKVLLNQAFTIERLQRLMTNQHFPIIHLSSHGTFSSDPKKTGIFAWNRQLDLPTLRQLIEQQGQQRSLELLVLSACETAKGDERSILGLAGVAAQSGARSTIASRWLVSEQSTVMLMDAFYRNLKQGLSKAEALRQAKLELIHSADFNHPFFWGSFTLIGSWL